MSKGTVLLTGASGFLALHTLESLLKADYDVVATVRSEARSADAKKIAAKYGRNVVFEIVPDIVAAGAFDNAFINNKSITKVVHTAANVTFAYKDVHTELIDPAVEGVLNVLKSVTKHAPQVDKVVITSSYVSVYSFTTAGSSKTVYNEKSWNDITIDRLDIAPAAGYGLAKTLAEKAFWDFIEKEKPSFTGTAINPPLIWGPIYGAVESASKLNTSSVLLYNVLVGKTPQGTLMNYIDVRDVADLHVTALSNPRSAGKRWVARAGVAFASDIIEYAKEAVPEYAKIAPEIDSEVDLQALLDRQAGLDATATLVESRITYRSLAETVADSAKSYAELGLFPKA